MGELAAILPVEGGRPARARAAGAGSIFVLYPQNRMLPGDTRDGRANRATLLVFALTSRAVQVGLLQRVFLSSANVLPPATSSSNGYRTQTLGRRGPPSGCSLPETLSQTGPRDFAVIVLVHLRNRSRTRAQLDRAAASFSDTVFSASRRRSRLLFASAGVSQWGRGASHSFRDCVAWGSGSIKLWKVDLNFLVSSARNIPFVGDCGSR